MKIVRYGCVALLVMMMTTVAAFGQLNGIYSIGVNTVPSEAGNYASLSAAVAALNSAGVSGPCTFYFTDNTTYSDTAVSLGCSGTSVTNTITFKPYTSVVCTLDFTSLIGKTIDGMWVIGSPNNASSNMVATHYVTVDGSNTNGGTSKDLTILNPSNIAQRSNFRIWGNCDNITIKNCIIVNRSTSGSTTAPINVTNYNTASVNYVPDNLTIQNNTLTSTAANGSLGITLSNSGTPTVGITGLVVRDNIISNRGTRAVMCNYVNDANIYGNTISSDNQQGGAAYASIWLSTGTSNAGTFNIYNNVFTQLKTINNTDGAGLGIVGIDNQLASPKIVNIYNNSIAGFTTTSATTNAKIYGIRHTGSSTSNIYHNTIYFQNMTNVTTVGTTKIAGIAFATHAATEAAPSGTMNVKNNIIVSDESTMRTYGIRRVGSSGTVSSDYNNFYFVSADSGFVGSYNGTDQKTLANWIANTVYDDNSKNVSVDFVSATDLHLEGASLGDLNLIGVSGLGISTDIDGNSRSGTYPYMGADEGATALPVELTGFTAISRGRSIELRWNTATETNNFGFEVERALPLGGGMGGGQQWTKVGFVPGAGTSNVPKEYSYSDAVSGSGRVSYRLKQIDIDGHFTYHNAIEVMVNAAVSNYDLAQNFPNPFNPNTTIRFSVKQMEQASVKVYDVAGREVAVLFNEVANAGQVYNVQFNASGLASGIYFYVLQTQSYREVKKMSLLK